MMNSSAYCSPVCVMVLFSNRANVRYEDVWHLITLLVGVFLFWFFFSPEQIMSRFSVAVLSFYALRFFLVFFLQSWRGTSANHKHHYFCVGGASLSGMT